MADESDEDINDDGGGNNGITVAPSANVLLDQDEEDRKGDHTISNFETIIHILKGNIGIGVLTLPRAIRCVHSSLIFITEIIGQVSVI